MYLSCFGWTSNYVTVATAWADLLGVEQICAGSIECFQGSASWLQFSKLTQAVVGKTTDSLITVDVQLSIGDVCKQFGSYVRLKCEKVGEPQTEKTAQRWWISESLTSRSDCQHVSNLLEPAKTAWLFNDLIDLFEEKKWTWHDGGRKLGKNVISSLCDTLWYIEKNVSTIMINE